MSTEETRSFEYEGSTVHVIARRKNKHREYGRRISRMLIAAGVEEGSAAEFSGIVAYTHHVDGKLWHPPSALASDAEIKAAFAVWLEEVDADLTDLWTITIYTRNADETTSPLPLGEGADPK